MLIQNASENWVLVEVGNLAQVQQITAECHVLLSQSRDQCWNAMRDGATSVVGGLISAAILTPSWEPVANDFSCRFWSSIC